MNTDFANVQAFVRAAVPDMLAAVQTGVKEARTRFMPVGGGHRCTWVMVERFQPPAGDTSGESEHVLARSNDMDLFAATPPSLYLTRPLSRAAELETDIVNFLDRELATYGKVEVLIQSTATDGTPCVSFTGSSENGYHNLAPVTVLTTP